MKAAMPDAATAARLVGQGILFGLAAAVPVGPVNVEMARRTLRGGFAAGASVGFGAVTVDVILAAASVLLLSLPTAGGGSLIEAPAIYWPLKLAGAGVLIFLGASCLRSAWRAKRPVAIPMPIAAPSAGRGYATGLLLNGLNPIVWSVWFVVLPGIVAKPGSAGGDGAGGSIAALLPMLCVGVFLATAGWVIAFSGALARLRHLRKGAADLLGGRWLAWVDTLGGLTLLGFAALTLGRPIWALLFPPG